MQKIKEIKVYSTKTCPFCIKTKKFLKEHNIEFESIDVGDDENARNEMINKSGQMSVPVIEIDGEFIVGFDEEKLKQKLNLED